MLAPTGKWGRGRSAKCATSCGKADITRIVRAKEAAPQPPQAFLFATSLRKSSFFTFDPEGLGGAAGSIISKKPILCIVKKVKLLYSC